MTNFPISIVGSFQPAKVPTFSFVTRFSTDEQIREYEAYIDLMFCCSANDFRMLDDMIIYQMVRLNGFKRRSTMMRTRATFWGIWHLSQNTCHRGVSWRTDLVTFNIFMFHNNVRPKWFSMYKHRPSTLPSSSL